MSDINETALNRAITDCQNSGGHELDLYDMELDVHCMQRIADELPEIEKLSIFIDGVRASLAPLGQYIVSKPALSLEVGVHGDYAVQALDCHLALMSQTQTLSKYGPNW